MNGFWIVAYGVCLSLFFSRGRLLQESREEEGGKLLTLQRLERGCGIKKGVILSVGVYVTRARWSESPIHLSHTQLACDARVSLHFCTAQMGKSDRQNSNFLNLVR